MMAFKFVFSGADVNFAMAVAEQGGIAIQRALDYRKMKDIES